MLNQRKRINEDIAKIVLKQYYYHMYMLIPLESLLYLHSILPKVLKVKT